MPVVTVIGASSRPFSIPISGNRVNTLGGQFEKSVGNAIGGGIPSGSDSVAGNGGGISMRSLDASDGLPTGVASSSSLDVGTVNGGENKFINNLGSHNTIYGGQGDTISAVDDLHVFQPGTDNRVTVGGSLTFVGGQGSESLHAGNATIYAGSGVVYHYVGTNAGNTQLQFEVGGSQNKNGVTLYEGVKGDKSGVLFDASSSHGSLLAHVGNGDTIIGGSASDTISVNNASAGAHGTSFNATLYGGSGAPNLFEFLNGQGGHYTIADFGSAAGNTVGLSASQMNNLQNVLDAETVSGGNTTIRLNDKTEITFLNDTHLAHNNFHAIK